MPSSYSVGDHFEGFIREMLDSGRYNSASEVVRESLRLLEEREQLRAAKLQALRQSIQDGLDSGPAEPLDMDEVKAEARRRWEATHKTACHGG